MPRPEPRLETGLSLFLFARPDQFTPNSFKTTLFSGADTDAAEAPRKRGEETHKRRGLLLKTREEMNKNGELIPQYRLRFVQPPNNCKFSSAHSATSSRFFINCPHLSTRNGTKQKRDNRQIKHKTELSAETL